MTDLEYLQARSHKHIKALRMFAKFEQHVRAALSDDLQCISLADKEGDDFLEVHIAGRQFRIVCSSKQVIDDGGLLTCYPLDPFTHKVLWACAHLEFDADAYVDKHDWMYSSVGAANVVARLVAPGLRQPVN